MLKYLHLVYLIPFIYVVDCESCERDKCRTVRNVIYQELIPHYREVGAKVPYKCPFFKDRDKYIAQEEHKERESASRWSCGYCGKAFIGEIYLDSHFTNRHSGSIYNEPDSVCLSDFCEIFRCDVLMGVAKPTFWDVALCMEDDMADLSQDCMDLMKSCVPEHLNWNASKTLTGALSESVCSYLTCKKYFDVSSIQEQEPVAMPYVVLTILLSIGLIIYYCVAVNYFWLDTFSDVYDSDDHMNNHPESLFPSELPKVSKSKHYTRKKANVIQTEASTGRQDIFNVRAGLETSIQSVPTSSR
ncbi:uncharacterized protein LOC132754696 isoform X2 [Ruditapes philippinarum]|uniref:uncharacterized protein LOC132754696 isoform X2 n=1 Tax=Ruditapes philippinarum TaxID=129788 RepID=UPI00295AAEBE|nr:uncharacterized protein LOC132754696 isoform X2 [Ruditapes philippinarum]